MISALLASVALLASSPQPLCVVTTETLSQKLAPCATALRPVAPLGASETLGAGEPGTWKLSVDDTSDGVRQAIVGFGAAWTDATVT
eukprot:1444452-Prymnesium_polylepis.1